MKITKGINPNCSETVYRLKQEDYEKHIDELSQLGGSFTGVGGDYSDLEVSQDDEITVHFYQTFGGSFMVALEKYEIPYTTQQWLVMFQGFKDGPLADYYEADDADEMFVRKPYSTHPSLYIDAEEAEE